MSLLFGLPLAAYVLLFLARLGGKPVPPEKTGIRAAALDAAVLWGVAVVAITEILSLFHALAVPGLACAWLLVSAAAGLLLLRRKSPRPLRGIWREAAAGFDDLEIALAAGILALLAGIGTVALVAPPNTTDVMTYHLPRIVHWLGNRSVAFYATHDLRQLHMPPWAEYAMLQFQGLAGSDRFDNLVQWFSFGGSALAASLIAGLLGAGRRGQMLAAVVCATIPQGLLEASGAKNECVTGFWLMALVYYLLRFREEPAVRYAAGAGAALGLACLTKTIAFAMAPALIAAVVLTGVPWRPRHAWLRGLAAAAVLTLALNAPHFVRNYRLFGSPLGPGQTTGENFKYTNDRFGPGALLSNVLRNAALHAATPLASVNQAVESGIVRILGAVGEDASDRRTTWTFTAFHVPVPSMHEGLAGNPLHAVLMLLVCAILAWSWRSTEARPALWLSAGIAGAFLLLCLVLRWQPWNARLHLPLFMLGAAVAGVVLARSWPRATAALAMLLLLAATPDVLLNQLRSLVGPSWNIFTTPRQDQYFADLSYLLPAYPDLVREAGSCPEIGLDMSQAKNEYPLYVLLRAAHYDRPVRNVFVTNPSRIYDPASNRPAACVICPECALRKPDWTSFERRFESVHSFGDISLLRGPIQAPPSTNACTAEFTGWYPWEKGGGRQWRWSSGKSEILVTAAQPLHTEMEAVVRSARYPNQVQVLVNGERKAVLHETTNENVLVMGIPTDLRPGENRIEFVSGNPPLQILPDTRQLAIMLERFALRTSGSKSCDVYPE